MSEPVRPATTRLRSDRGPQADPDVASPSTEELEAIERQRVDWTRLLGASVEPAADLGTLVTHPRPGSSLNFIAGLRWPADGVADRLASVINWMSDRGAWPSVITAEGLSAPADLAARLGAAGWLPVSAERIMFARHPAVVPHLDPGLRVEAVTPASAIDCVRLETASFGLLPEAIGESAELLASSVAEGTTRAFVMRLAGEPVASARLVPGRPATQTAALHAVGVAPRHRRRGYGRMLTTIATRAGLATGHSLVWLSVDEANTPAVELYRSIGFAPTFSWTRWLAPAG